MYVLLILCIIDPFSLLFFSIKVEVCFAITLNAQQTWGQPTDLIGRGPVDLLGSEFCFE